MTSLRKKVTEKKNLHTYTKFVEFETMNEKSIQICKEFYDFVYPVDLVITDKIMYL